MPLSIDDNLGPIKQTQGEILDETNASFVSVFGADLQLGDQDYVYRQNAIWANREDALQSGIVAAIRAADLDRAVGQQLDYLGSLLGRARKAPTRSTISALLRGDPGALVGDRRVRYVLTGDLWRTGANSIIGADGTASVTLTAEATGPIFASAQASTAWVIVDVTDGWTSVESVADAQRGVNRELDPAYRARLKSAISGGLASEPATKVALGNTPGVTAFTLDNNRKAATNANGVPGFHVEAIVEGGTDLDVATTLYNTVGLGCGFHGTTTIDVVDPSDGAIEPVKFSRIRNLQVTGTFAFQLSGDTDLPIGAASTVAAAIVDRINTNGAGIDVDPGDLLAVGALALPPGVVEPDDSIGQVAFKGGALQTDPLIISDRERAFTVNVDQPAAIVGTEIAPFDLTADDQLTMIVNGGLPFELTINVEDYTIVSEATITELITSFTAQAPAGLLIGSQNGALAFTSALTGESASIRIDAASDATLLAELGLSVQTVNGSGPDIEVTFTGP